MNLWFSHFLHTVMSTYWFSSSVLSLWQLEYFAFRNGLNDLVVLKICYKLAYCHQKDTVTICLKSIGFDRATYTINHHDWPITKKKANTHKHNDPMEISWSRLFENDWAVNCWRRLYFFLFFSVVTSGLALNMHIFEKFVDISILNVMQQPNWTLPHIHDSVKYIQI